MIIRDNVLSSGSGLFTQSIFMRNDQVDQGLAGDSMFYRNITIANNIIVNAHLHGITVGETDGLLIRNNTVVLNPSSEGEKRKPALWTPQIRVAQAARNVEITRNMTSKVVGYTNQKDWDVCLNLHVQRTNSEHPGHYELIFGRDSIETPRNPTSFALRSDGGVNTYKIGSSLSLSEIEEVIGAN